VTNRTLSVMMRFQKLSVVECTLSSIV